MTSSFDAEVGVIQVRSVTLSNVRNGIVYVGFVLAGVVAYSIGHLIQRAMFTEAQVAAGTFQVLSLFERPLTRLTRLQMVRPTATG